MSGWMVAHLASWAAIAWLMTAAEVRAARRAGAGNRVVDTNSATLPRWPTTPGEAASTLASGMPRPGQEEITTERGPST